MLLNKDQITSWLNKLIPAYQVFAPVKEGDYFCFQQIRSGEQAVLNYTNSRIPPKEILFPRSEKLFCYRCETGGVQLTEQVDESKKVVVGVRPCDAKSFLLLDKVFNGDQYVDPYYLTRRNNTVLVGLGCNQPAATCFCTSLSGGPFSAEGLDLLFVDIGDQYLVEVVTERGKELLSGMELPVAGQEAQEAARAVKESAVCSTLVDLGGLKYRLDVNFDDPIWALLAEKCLGCAACTYTCPTCHCFDIVDEAAGKEGCRIRNWDACMFPLFTLHGSGHNPRPTGKERFRQRIMHKFKYFVDNYGTIACVGCGRCILSCPVNLDIRQVIEQISQAGGDQQ
ncbi:MAG: 4Fe-4S dicluster domain-containing protein [Armatimonadetes bacterium]|nr:4Fe-4S dicluster domain-containing protein [Armatimonadota bacterium]